MRNFHLFLPLFLFLSLSHYILISTHTYVHIQNAPKVCDDFRVAILMKCVECKKHKKNHRVSLTIRHSV